MQSMPPSPASAPLVSVVIPSFNRAATIGKAIRSVLDQTWQNFEIIIVDDASREPLDAVVQQFQDARLQLLVHPNNRGVSAARNTGIDAARGRFVAFLDSDDFWLPGKLAAQVATALAAPDPERVVCLVQTRIVMPDGWERTRPLSWPPAGQSFARFLYGEGGFAQCSSFFLATKLARKIRFNEQLRQYEDHLFLMEAEHAGGVFRMLSEVHSVWMNDDRPDRLSGDETEARVGAFIAVARKCVPAPVLAAFTARTTCELVWKNSRRRALSLLARAVGSGGMTPTQAAIILLRMIVPAASYQRLRKRLTAS